MSRPVSSPTTALALLVAAGLGGCGTTHYVAQVPLSLKCEVPAAMTTACPTPQPLKAGLTYRELVEAHLTDRQQLQRCAAQQEDLRRLVTACNARIDAHNAELARSDAVGKAAATPPRGSPRP